MDSTQVDWIFQRETFRYFFKQFDVDKAKRLLKKKAHKIELLPISYVASMIDEPESGKMNLLSIYVDWNQIGDTTDLSIPLIAGTVIFGKGKNKTKPTLLVIDGWHRIAKAKRDGITELPCFLLDEKETKRVHL